MTSGNPDINDDNNTARYAVQRRPWSPGRPQHDGGHDASQEAPALTGAMEAGPGVGGGETGTPARSWVLVLVGLPLLTVVVVGLAWWLVPLVLVDPAGYTTTVGGRAVVDVPELTAAQTAVRAPLGIVAAALLAAMTAGAGVLVNHRTTALTRRGQDQAAERDLASRELTRRAQHNDRYVTALDLLHREPTQNAVRIGALYALEQLAREEPGTYQQTVTDVVAAYVRERAGCEHWRDREDATLTDPVTLEEQEAPGVQASSQEWAAWSQRYEAARGLDGREPAADVVAALTVLARRARTWRTPAPDRSEERPDTDAQTDVVVRERGPVNLRRVHLPHVYLRDTHLTGVNLEQSCLQGAVCADGVFEGSSFYGCRASGSDFTGADLRWADLRYLLIDHASLVAADLRGARIEYLIADETGLHDADLRELDFTGASMEGASLAGAKVHGAHLQSVQNLLADTAQLAISDEHTRWPPDVAEERAQTHHAAPGARGQTPSTEARER